MVHLEKFPEYPDDPLISQTLLARSGAPDLDGEILSIRCERTVPPSDTVVCWTRGRQKRVGSYRTFERDNQDLLNAFRTYFDYDFPQILQPHRLGYDRLGRHVIDVGGNRSILLTRESKDHDLPLHTRIVTTYISFGNQADDRQFEKACRTARKAGKHACIVGYTDPAPPSFSEFGYTYSTPSTGVYTQQSAFPSTSNVPIGFQSTQAYSPSLSGARKIESSGQQWGSSFASGSNSMGPPYYPNEYRKQ
jgi:hypothetical protein